MSQQTVLDGQKLIMKRVFDAPVERVYQAWTDRDKMSRWLASNERWIQTKIDLEAHPGGKHNITMRHQDGDQFHIIGKYLEIVPNERISFTWSCPESGMGDEDSVVTVEFRPVSGGTELTLIHDRLADELIRDQHAEGWVGCLDMLEGYLIHGTELRATV